MMLVACGIAIVCFNQPTAQRSSTSPTPSPAPRADPCGGPQELLKKYLSASPCVFVRGQASIQATYSGTNVPVVVTHTAGGSTVTVQESSHAYGYPGALIHIGITPTSQITVVLPSFSRVDSTQTGSTAGASDMEFRYKALVYVDRKRGILGGILATYEAPTGSPGIAATGPSYQINPLLNIALNRARTIGENLSFPVTNSPGTSMRSWSFAPQAVTFWRSPGGTLLAVVVQHAFSPNSTYLTLNTAQLLARNFQLQGTFGGNNMLVDYVNPVEAVDRAQGVAYSRSFTIGVSFLMGHSELSNP
jgi:hypothetical protein